MATRNTDDLMNKLSHTFGDIRAPGNGMLRAAFDIANQRLSGRTVDYAVPVGSAKSRGEPERYDGLIPSGSNAEVHAHVAEMRKLLDKQPDEKVADVEKRHASLQQIAASRGYTKEHYRPDSRGGLEFSKAQPSGYYEREDRNGEKIRTPMYGQVEGSKYAHLSAQPAEEMIYSGGKSANESKFHDTPQAPRKRDGSIDYEAVMKHHNTPQPSGRPGSINTRRG